MTQITPSRSQIPELNPPYRLLLGPGPCNVDPRVLRISSAPQLGHLDPEMFTILEETAALLREVFQTKNDMTLCVSGSGFSGAEAVLSNLLEEGDTLIAGSLGFFSGRIVDIASRVGATVINLETEPGQPLEAATLEKAFQENPGVKLFATAVAETSTGLRQPLEELERVTHAHGALFVVDAVCGLGGIPVKVDEWKIDACYAGSQKCLGALPGLAPVTLNERALETIKKRRKPVQSYYLNLEALNRYWNGDHTYHHTICSNLVYGMREALRITCEEGLEARFARHQLHGDALKAGIKALGLRILTEPGYELPVLTAILLPKGVDEMHIRKTLLSRYNIEIGGGFGALQGRLIRIGLMGYNANSQNVYTVLEALEHVLPESGYPVTRGTAIQAVDDFYASQH
ncbi:alanine-glyoxylate transaminase/serine-glyoxylate transaminase/serine-pyruvate transaminase [Thermosporothrix hazakensis]|uniref:Alanine-glyoxylate transaminase/serine-glyoxylate transaminase/serine-pyruvate transaminase n=1 Tax=Thermosporothrix hazakensis TaxID=644383 RepID=A0A326UDV7_THEHA|nr:alanine--glyoxylate aminotransferase family protein [Thermosporothrix hazakensis]PZW36476.1 alanine-glyoxylate transaminase/serine-glyoxylate transaminase/serine-pyruvate transaminase [Thermosporothrix hazakensis]GCE47130.1 alanine--glyoxylate aminotransferase [Thermosporothrix hazakensis]